MGLEICLIIGLVSLNLLYWTKNLLTDICGPGERVTRKQLTSRPDHLWPARAGISCNKKEEPIKNSSIIRWTFFQSLSMSSRKEDLMDIDMVKSRETGNTLRLTN